ncbi:MAG: DUF45 domain-containing protein [Clostridia bacterium]|nr:DUF45 domain-containing protein [Clostridia bacterium]
MERYIVQFKRVRRSKHLRISVNSDAKIVVSRPMWLSERKARYFLEEKKDWLIKQIERIEAEGPRLLAQGSRSDYLQNKEKARRLVLDRIKHFNQFYAFKYSRLSIRDQKSRWGSCSHKLGLNFNYRIIYLEPDLVDYLVVHELCHLQEMNHGPRFWALVKKTIDNYPVLRKRLRKL